jgi:UDP-N-acetylglucosamine:LPS N-acetylglucosamine transferase
MNTTSGLDTLWVGGEGGMEAALVQRALIPFQTIPAAGVHGVGLRSLPRNLGLLVRGFRAAGRILRKFKPDVLLFTGGYVAVPMALAGRRFPSLVYVPDIEPGLALKTIARFADRIALSTESSRRYFRRRAGLVVSGYPVRSGFVLQNKAAARSKLGLEPDTPTLLVFGGSKGARSINNALLKSLDEILDFAQVVHLTGDLDWPLVEQQRRDLIAPRAARYHAFPYLHEDMAIAMAAADLALSRAGASSLGEFPAVGLPAVLVPYPYAWRYQKVNADFLASEGAALVIEDEHLEVELTRVVSPLLRNTESLASMARSMRRLARPEAAERIAAELRRLAGGSE